MNCDYRPCVALRFSSVMFGAGFLENIIRLVSVMF